MRCNAIRNWLCVWIAALSTRLVVSAFPKRIPIGKRTFVGVLMSLSHFFCYIEDLEAF